MIDTERQPKSDDQLELVLRESLVGRYGNLMCARDCARELGFRTAGAFARAAREGTIRFALFPMAGRTGRYALTLDVAAWLISLRDAPTRTDLATSTSPGERGPT